MWKKQKMEVAKEQCIHDQAAKAQGWRFFLAGFFLTVLITGIGFACLTVWPFGDKTVLIIDSLHQYLPFYTDMHNKLVNGGSLLYSFSGGLGYNFWSTYAYYLASPLNFLMVLIPTANVWRFYGSDDPFENRSVRRMLCLVSAQTGSEAALSSGRIWCDVCPEQFCDRVLF